MAISNLKLGAFTVLLLAVWGIYLFFSVEQESPRTARPLFKRFTGNCGRILKVILEQILVGYK